jgi:DNA-binding HxlR family transcriptional regulator
MLIKSSYEVLIPLTVLGETLLPAIVMQKKWAFENTSAILEASPKLQSNK